MNLMVTIFPAKRKPIMGQNILNWTDTRPWLHWDTCDCERTTFGEGCVPLAAGIDECLSTSPGAQRRLRTIATTRCCAAPR